MPTTTTDPDGRLAGSPAAQSVLRQVVADPGAERLVDVVGAGGYGKSVLLDALAAAWTAAGTPVRREVPDGAPDPAVALVVDDAHLLSADDLLRLAGHAAVPGARVVVA
ncbi:MAG: helix-turn-helix transcriptional regulator, partial [Pseudonocardiales bacterium]|nr:helix-turn-helix transcriptional regulator [Pseudonocardiales bacterium]